MELCISKGIRLIQIFEDEWINKKDVVISNIEKIIKKSSKNIIDISNCQFKKINNQESIDYFLKRNSLVEYSYKLDDVYGIYFNNNLISIGNFSDENNGESKLQYYLEDIDYKIIGGFEWFINNFISLKKCKMIIYELDLRWNIEKDFFNLKKLNITKIYNLDPEVFYTNGYVRTKENIYKNKIYDAGKIVFNFYF